MSLRNYLAKPFLKLELESGNWKVAGLGLAHHKFVSTFALRHICEHLKLDATPIIQAVNTLTKSNMHGAF